MYGQTVAEYSYDAWGNILSAPTAGAGARNPFRYRGYYYDTETGLYYLQSRYYDPEVGRFVNADDVEASKLSCLHPNLSNLYVYCRNNPVVTSDPTGHLDGAVMKMVQGFSASALFASYASGLYTALAATLAKISLYVTGVLLPKIAALFWWQPWLVVGIVVAAVAIVITAVTIYTNNRISSMIRNINIDIYRRYKSQFQYAGKGNPNDLKRGMTKNQKEKFQRAIEDMKKYSGKPPNFNLPWDVLVAIANEIKKSFK